MSRFVSILASRLHMGPCLCILAVCGLLAVSGCANLNLRGEEYPDNSMSDLAQRIRQVDNQAQSFAFSNKARQIDRNLGPVR